MNALDVTLTKSATEELDNLTSDNIGRVMQIVVDGQIVNQATIQSDLGQKFQITFNSNETAEKVYKALSGE